MHTQISTGKLRGMREGCWFWVLKCLEERVGLMFHTNQEQEGVSYHCQVADLCQAEVIFVYISGTLRPMVARQHDVCVGNLRTRGFIFDCGDF